MEQELGKVVPIHLEDEMQVIYGLCYDVIVGRALPDVRMV